MILQTIRPKKISGSAVFLVLLLSAAAASAQDRSETGRHKPKPAVEVKEESTVSKPVEIRDPQARHWYLGATGGIQQGSDLFRVEVSDETGEPLGPISDGGLPSRFTTSLARDFSFGLFLARDLGSTWTLRADFGYSRMDVEAEALIDQIGAVLLFDRMSVVTVGLGVEARLTSAPSYPYAQFSVLMSHLDPEWADSLEQTNFGGRLGLGYLQSFKKMWGLRFETRLSGTGFSVGDHFFQPSLPDQPEIEYQTEDHLLFFEFLIGVQARI